MKKNFWEGMFFVILAQIMVGVNIVFSKYVLTTIPVLLILTLRFSLASILLLGLHYLSPARKVSILFYCSQLKRKDWFFILGQALTAGIFFNGLMLWGLHYTDANAAGIITSALPAIIALMSWLILREKISGQKIVCIGLATLGLIVIAADKLHGAQSMHSFRGDFIIIVSLFPEAAYYILSKIYFNALPVFLISSLLNGINALFLVAMSLGYWGETVISTFAWFILTILGLSSGLFYVFWYFGCQKVDGLTASLSTAVMPLVTIILAWVVLGEQLSLIQMGGMAMVILSIVANARR